MHHQLLREGALLTLQKGSDITLSVESANQQAAAIQNKSQKGNQHMNVFKVKKQEFSCFCCTGKHNSKVCPFITKQHFYCKNKGYIEYVPKENCWRAHSSKIVMEMHHLEDEAEDSILLVIYWLNHNAAPPLEVNIEVN